MSSSSTSLSLAYIGEQITIYGGVMIISTGILGNLISIIVFLSLETFRQSSCAFYLTIMSFVNIGQLICGLLSRILITGFAIDWTTTSLFYCKFRVPFLELCSLMSYACLCLATIDQYFATCTRVRWQQWCNIKLAHRLIIIFTIISCFIVIPYPIFLNQFILSTGKISCTINNNMFSRYRNYVVVLFLIGYIPDLISVIFGILAYRNTQQIAYRTIPLVRRELDKQLTTMVLLQVVVNLFTNVPCITMNALIYATSYVKNSSFLERNQFIYIVTLVIFYSYFASSFYIYIYVSERFRRQLIYVFRVIHLDRWQRQRIFINQVVPS